MGLVFLYFITDSEIVVKTIRGYRGIGEETQKNLTFHIMFEIEENVMIGYHLFFKVK